MPKKVFTKLKKHPGIWRVDGIGEISRINNGRARINVCFSEIHKNEVDNPYRNSALTGRNLCLNYHSSAISEFIVGTVWAEGLNLCSAPILQPVLVDVNQTRFIRLNDHVRLNSATTDDIIPSYLFDFNSNRSLLQHTHYALIPVLNNKFTQWLIIPSSEIYRFYIGVSQLFCNPGLANEFNDYVNWESSKYEKDTVTIYLKKPISLLERFVLLEAISSEKAKASLNIPHQYLSAAINYNRVSHDKKPLIIKSNFPFSGITSLTVAGKRIPLLNTKDKYRDEWAIFGMEIHHCTHQTQFSKAEVIHEYATTPSNSPEEGDKDYGTPQQHAEQLDDEIGINDAPADAKIKRLRFINFSNRFSCMRNISYAHKSLSTKISNNTATNIKADVKGYTLEDGNYEKDSEGNVGVCAEDTTVPIVVRGITNFIKMLHYLREKAKDRDWDIVTRKLHSGVPHEGDIITMFPLNMGARYSWHKITDKKNNTRTRQVVWVEICIEGEYLYLVEIELKPSESGLSTLVIKQDDGAWMDNNTFHDLLILTAVRNHWPAEHHAWKKQKHRTKAKELFKKIITERISHPSERVSIKTKDKKTTKHEPWAEVILEKIDAIILKLNND